MDDLTKAIQIAQKLQEDMEAYYLKQNEIIKELREKLESYAYPDMMSEEERKDNEKHNFYK